VNSEPVNAYIVRILKKTGSDILEMDRNILHKTPLINANTGC
jgi:hypothetical protein